jgi:hypothetical protein
MSDSHHFASINISKLFTFLNCLKNKQKTHFLSSGSAVAFRSEQKQRLCRTFPPSMISIGKVVFKKKIKM